MSTQPDAYEAIKNDPDVLLCEHMQACVAFVTFALMGRNESGGFDVSPKVLDILRLQVSDRRVVDADRAQGEVEQALALRALMQNVIDGARPDPAESKDLHLASETVEQLRDLTLDARFRPYAPKGEKYMEVRERLHRAAGKTPPPLPR